MSNKQPERTIAPQIANALSNNEDPTDAELEAMAEEFLNELFVEIDEGKTA